MLLQQGIGGGLVHPPSALDIVAEQGFQHLHGRSPVLDQPAISASIASGSLGAAAERTSLPSGVISTSSSIRMPMP